MAKMTVVLGRRLLSVSVSVPNDDDGDVAMDREQAMLRCVQSDDRFFCDLMELIPAQYYFATDEDDNWRKSAPKKYHRDVLSQKQQASSKNALKRAKFNPREHKTNEQRLLDTAAEEAKQKQKQTQNQTQKQQAEPVQVAKSPSAVSFEGLKARLAAKVSAMREQRNAGDRPSKSRKAAATATATAATLTGRKRKATAMASSLASKKRQGADRTAVEADKTSKHSENSGTTGAESATATATSISYGSLLLADATDGEHKPTTRNGQAVRGIKNLLKKAERNQQRMQELKKTEEGKALLQAKGWSKAIQQAGGGVVLDDPKLLRRKLKKKEKQKSKSTREWSKRKTEVEMHKKQRQKTRLENLRTGGKKETPKDAKKGREQRGPRPGFEGKKGDAFLNGDKKKPAAAATASSKKH